MGENHCMVSKHGSGTGIPAVICLVLLAALLAVPVSAGEKYLYGKPELGATISGTNEFSPGDDASLVVKVQNTGTYEVKLVQSTLLSTGDDPTKAKLLRVTLQPGSAPVTVKTDTQMVGDLTGGSTATATFTVAIARGAAAGTYDLPVFMQYTYLLEAEQLPPDTVRYFYTQKEETIPLTIRITPDVELGVMESTAEHLNVGTEGYLNLLVRNNGTEHARNAIIKLSRNDASPLVPTDSSVFIGDYPPGAEARVRFKVSVSGNAEAQSYPVDLSLEYLDSEGATATSETVTVGVPVGGKIEFEVVSAPPQVNPGQKVVIPVEIRNTGAVTAYNAQARLSAVDPFTSNDDTAYLGDLAPGETAVASFEITVDSGATPKSYGLDSEVRYRDALDNTQISDTMKVDIDVVSRSGLAAALTNPIVLSIIIAIVIGAGYYLLKMRRKEG
ncbi:MAG: COG1361 S-layer family protein [Methanomicrobiales archaeon]|nr:COG1361 S-layer family protein [Methanomicrobiales archaeon]